MNELSWNGSRGRLGHIVIAALALAGLAACKDSGPPKPRWTQKPSDFDRAADSRSATSSTGANPTIFKLFS